MTPDQWGTGDVIAAWLFLAVPAIFALSLGGIFNYIRTKGQHPTPPPDRSIHYLSGWPGGAWVVRPKPGRL